MTRFLRSIAPASIVAVTLVGVSPATATEVTDARDVANPERMREPAAPVDERPAVPGDRKWTRPEAPSPSNSQGAQPQPPHPDEGYHATVGRDASQAASANAQPPARPEIDPAVAAEEKPGAAAELAAKPVRKSEEVAAASAHERGFANVINDLYTSARVKMSLAMDSRTPAMDINVDTTDSRVTLFGIVPSDEAKFAAGADALSIAGVQAVDNTLQVVAEDRKADVLARDVELQQILRKNLEPYPSMQGVGIDVKNCVARLTGTVHAGKERDEAMLVVRKTPGVCQVKDDVRFNAT
jgi:osmotically-inducible protein OsmY